MLNCIDGKSQQILAWPTLGRILQLKILQTLANLLLTFKAWQVKVYIRKCLLINLLALRLPFSIKVQALNALICQPCMNESLVQR